MLVVQLIILAIWLIGIPTIVGNLFIKVDERSSRFALRWVGGQMLLWALFQLICVPLILQEDDFHKVVVAYGGMTLALVLISVAYALRAKTYVRYKEALSKREGKSKKELFYWAVFWVLLIFQLVQAVLLMYADGDDSFYVAVSSITNDSDTMYRKLAYQGGATELDARHGLAPLPIWISFLARLSGMKPVSVAHVVIPVVLIAMTYAIYYLLGQRLFEKKKESIPLFLIFAEILVLFGDYSFQTVETFMIARSRQGKAALGNIIIPMLLFLLLLLLEKVQEEENLRLSYWVLFIAVVMSACLCSTLGAFLICLLVGVTGLCGAVAYRRWKLLFPMAACCAPAVCYALLYLILE